MLQYEFRVKATGLTHFREKCSQCFLTDNCGPAKHFYITLQPLGTALLYKDTTLCLQARD